MVHGYEEGCFFQVGLSIQTLSGPTIILMESKNGRAGRHSIDY